MKRFNNKHIIFFVIGIFVFIAGGIYYFVKNSNSDFIFESEDYAEPEELQELEIAEINLDTGFIESPLEDSEPENTEIKVYITGAIKDSGVYILESGSRIDDLIKLAGGFSEDADLIKTNLAEEIFDEQHIHIYEINEEPIPEIVDTNTKTTTNNTTQPYTGLVNINTASSAELSTISGIGEVIAQNIIAYRESSGQFNSIEDIKNVNRIGDKTFENIKKYITVD